MSVQRTVHICILRLEWCASGWGYFRKRRSTTTMCTCRPTCACGVIITTSSCWRGIWLRKLRQLRLSDKQTFVCILYMQNKRQHYCWNQLKCYYYLMWLQIRLWYRPVELYRFGVNRNTLAIFRKHWHDRVVMIGRLSGVVVLHVKEAEQSTTLW